MYKNSKNVSNDLNTLRALIKTYPVSTIRIWHEELGTRVRPVPIETKSCTVMAIDKVIYNDPATIVLWSDGTKTVVKCQTGDIFDKEKGLAMAISKKVFGNTGSYCEVFKRFAIDTNEDNKSDDEFEYTHPAVTYEADVEKMHNEIQDAARILLNRFK